MFFSRLPSKKTALDQDRSSLPLMVTKIIVLGTLTSCVTPPPITTFESSISNPMVAQIDDVLVLQPLLTYESIYNEKSLHPAEFGGDGIEIILFNSAKRAVISGTFDLVEPGTAERKLPALTSEMAVETGIAAPDEGDIITGIRLTTSQLSHGTIDDKTGNVLKSVCSDKKDRAILANHVRVKVGLGGTWDPNSGAITSSNSSSVLNAALIQCDIGQILWKKQVLLRDIPELGAEKFSDSIELLYYNFPRKGDKQ